MQQTQDIPRRRFECDPERDRAKLDDDLAAAPPRSASTCARMVRLATSTVPGRVGAVARALADQGDGAAVDALLMLPQHVPGVVEGTFAAITRGVSRPRRDGTAAPSWLALELRATNARGHGALQARVQAAFASAQVLESLVPGPVERPAPTLFRVVLRSPAQVSLGEELGRIASRALVLAGSRLWVHGWCFDRHGPFRPTAAALLVDAWCRRARATENATAAAGGPHE